MTRLPTVPALRRALTEVLDPEYPVSLVDLGLVRGIELEGTTVRVRVTFCSLGCPCIDMIRDDIEARLLQFESVERVEIEEVFERWSRRDISSKGLSILRETSGVAS